MSKRKKKYIVVPLDVAEFPDSLNPYIGFFDADSFKEVEEKLKALSLKDYGFDKMLLITIKDTNIIEL